MDAPEIVYLRRSINRDVGQIKCSFNLYDTAASGIRHIGKTREKEPRGGTKIVKIMTNLFKYLHLTYTINLGQTLSQQAVPCLTEPKLGTHTRINT